MLRGQTYPIEMLSNRETKALLLACNVKCATGCRNRALLVTMLRGGLRVSEALALKPSDVDMETGELTVLSGKGKKRRVVGLQPGALAIIAAWIERRKALKINGRRKLFCTLTGGSIYSSYVRTLLKRLAVKAKIDKRVHPHALRHHYASMLVKERVSLPEVQQALGHSSLSTTATYVSHIAPHELVERLAGLKWEL